jgi:acetyl esterase/lipase
MLPLATFTNSPNRFALLSMLVGEGGLDVTTGLAYGPAPRQRLDVYRPRRDLGTGPVALFLYGGSWRGGCRGCYGFVGAALASAGMAAAVADYRLFPEVRWPAFQEDAAAAFRFVHAELADAGRRPVAVIGHSAGAHMAALLAFDRTWLGEMRPAGLVGLSGPYAFRPTEWPTTRDIFATARSPDAPRPLSHAGNGAPPALLVHGADDTTVKPHNTAELAARLRACRVPVTEIMLAGAGHKDTVAGFARPLRARLPVLAPTLAFLRGLDHPDVTAAVRSAARAASAPHRAG